MILTVLSGLLSGFLSSCSKNKGRVKIKNWLCCYGTGFESKTYTKFDLVVFDGFNHPPLIKSDNKPIYLGYVSIGEMDIDHPLWEQVKNKPFLAKKNEMWNSWMVDVRSEEWQKLLFEKIISQVINNGFDGLFLDTLDSSLHLGQGKTKDLYSGIEKELVKIIKNIKIKFPKIYVAVNRGLPILPQIAKSIDYVLVEDLYSYYAGKEKGYIEVDSNTQKILLSQIKAGRSKNKELTVLSLDYADENQSNLAKSAIKFSKKQGFVPYVSTFDLQQIFFYAFED